jgi:hypothetical protein
MVKQALVGSSHTATRFALWSSSCEVAGAEVHTHKAWWDWWQKSQPPVRVSCHHTLCALGLLYHLLMLGACTWCIVADAAVNTAAYLQSLHPQLFMPASRCQQISKQRLPCPPMLQSDSTYCSGAISALHVRSPILAAHIRTLPSALLLCFECSFLSNLLMQSGVLLSCS